MNKGRTRARAFIAIAAGAAITWLMLGGPSGRIGERAGGIIRTIGEADLSLVLYGAVLYSASIAARAFRLDLLSVTGLKKTRALQLTALHAGLGHVLPVRLSDFALIGLLRGYAGIPSGQGTGMVILSKLLDLASMGLVISTAFFYGAGGNLTLAALAALCAGAAGLLLLPVALGRISGLAGGPLEKPAVKRFLSNLGEAADIWRRGRLRFFHAFLLSLAAWLAKLAMFVLLSRAVGLDEPAFWQVFFAGAVTDLIMALPVHGLFNLGTAEAGWTAGFAIVGISGESVLTSGFSVHLLWMLMAVAGMLAAIPFLRLEQRDVDR